MPRDWSLPVLLRASLAVSRELMEAVGLLAIRKDPGGQNVTSGSRFETYVIPEAQPGQVVG